MKRLFLILLLVFTAYLANAQIQASMVKWSCELPQNYEMGDTISIKITADLEDEWFMYSSDYDSTGTTSPAKFGFKGNGTLGFFEGIHAIGSHEYHDTVLDETVKIMKGKAIFVQKAIVYYSPAHLEGSVEYFIEKRTDDSSLLVPLTEIFDKRF